ncbi:DcuS/MalK family sensor histidine kinase [Bacillus sp. USDA818B3_A]|uniref:DcuS/MalK family sensor histidine kinase n=1 Tax=Bacillus sp. USDA818B3_A TaxID=2698834 RepID=UPI001EFF825A|nr:DcuS/MalK family sensor histidine kinase [Bacillus sp. USDA818B3_A]
MRKKRPRFRFRLQTTITFLVCGVVALALFVTDMLISNEIGSTTYKNQSEKAMNIAKMIAHSPIIIEGLQNPQTEKKIQKFTQEMTKITNVEFIVVMDMNGIRKSHPKPEKIGERFVGGDEGPALHGHENISTAKGTLGYSLRAFTPVFSDSGQQIGAVSVGISLNKVKEAVKNSKEIIYLAVVFGVLIGIIGAIYLARKIKKSMFGLEPFEIGKLLEERSAMLQSTKEGILAVDQDGSITLINNEAMRLFKEAGINDNPMGNAVNQYLPELQLQNVLETGKPLLNEEINLSGITLLANHLPIIVRNQMVGAITTFRNKTEINQLAEELTGVKLYAEALRAQSHEFLNKMHVVLGLVHLEQYEKLADFIDQISDHLHSEVGYVISKIKDPALAGFVLAKMSYARELGSELSFSGDGILPEPATPETTHELITIIGNLVDNALEALTDCDQQNKKVSIHFDYYEHELVVEVADNGPGIKEDLVEMVYLKGVSTKGYDRGIGLYLVRRSLDKLQGQLELSTEAGKGTRFTVTIPY